MANHTEMTTIEYAKTDEDIHGILGLQQANLRQNLTETQLRQEGFVTLMHDAEWLKQMNRSTPSIIAKDQGKMVGYCLAMTPTFRHKAPALEPMFDILEDLVFKGKPFYDYKFIIGGQVCVAASHRGQQIFDKMHDKFRALYQTTFDLMATDIATINQRSLNAHLRVGFEVVHVFSLPHGETWEIVVWDWRENQRAR